MFKATFYRICIHELLSLFSKPYSSLEHRFGYLNNIIKLLALPGIDQKLPLQEKMFIVISLLKQWFGFLVLLFPWVMGSYNNFKTASDCQKLTTNFRA